VEVVGFSFLIPVFFVTSGMTIDAVAVLAQWPLLVGFVAMIALVRGLPVVLREMFTTTHSGLQNTREKAALGLYAATGLP
uniref:cation:proton antiporter domain-containing protein n=1 Tax=Pseudomonas aeruginosa TaxID=287 RepID=UPI00187A7376